MASRTSWAAGWFFRVNVNPPMLGIGIKKAHDTSKDIKENGTFSVNIPSADMVDSVDYCGLVSGEMLISPGSSRSCCGDLGEVFELLMITGNVNTLGSVSKMQVPKIMRAMVLEKTGEPLKHLIVPVPKPNPDQILIKIHACGVCRTDLHIVDGELTNPKLPLIPGHEIVGTVVHMGEHVKNFQLDEKIGTPWLGYTDGTCRYCRSGRENLCDHALFTGYTIDGGYAEYTVADHRYCFRVPDGYSDIEAAPLMCAGLIGYRSYRMAVAESEAERLGIYGFGAAAHIITQVAVFMRKKVYAFTRPGDIEAQEFARRLGAIWAGESSSQPPEKLDAAIIFAPVGSLVPIALSRVAKKINGPKSRIRMVHYSSQRRSQKEHFVQCFV